MKELTEEEERIIAERYFEKIDKELEEEMKNKKDSLDKEGEEISKFIYGILEELNDMMIHSERAVAIIYMSHIEDIFKEFIKSKLIDADNKDAEYHLFGPNGIIGSFFSQITLAYHVGFISKDVSNILNTLRQIRNDFAHSKKNIGLSDEPIKHKMNNIEKILIKDEWYMENYKFQGKDNTGKLFGIIKYVEFLIFTYGEKKSGIIKLDYES